MAPQPPLASQPRHQVFSLFFGVVMGWALFFIGLSLVGILAASVTPSDFGLSAQTIYAPLSFLAWGLPAFVVWMLAAWAFKPLQSHAVWTSVLVECTALLFFAPLPDSFESALASAEVYGWPILFIAALSRIAWFFGVKLHTRS